MTDAIDAAQRLLDLHIVDANGQTVGKVDDLELAEAEHGGAPYVSAVLCGPLAFGPRLGGRLGLWWTTIAARMRPEENPEPVRIDFGLLDVEATQLRASVPEPDLLGTRRLETWLREHLIGRLPGSER